MNTDEGSLAEGLTNQTFPSRQYSLTEEQMTQHALRRHILIDISVTWWHMDVPRMTFTTRFDQWL